MIYDLQPSNVCRARRAVPAILYYILSLQKEYPLSKDQGRQKSKITLRGMARGWAFASGIREIGVKTRQQSAHAKAPVLSRRMNMTKKYPHLYKLKCNINNYFVENGWRGAQVKKSYPQRCAQITHKIHIGP